MGSGGITCFITIVKVRNCKDEEAGGEMIEKWSGLLLDREDRW